MNEAIAQDHEAFTPQFHRELRRSGRRARAGHACSVRRQPGARRKRRAEINMWVAIKPDDTCRDPSRTAEMGQGTLTGLAQLVAEELDCDWRRSRPSRLRPARTLRASAPGATWPPAAAAASARSQDYLRQSGAAARMMLLQAAADEWKVPVGELTASNGVITHAASKRSTSLR